MTSISAESVRLAALHSNQPLVLRGFVRDWELCSKSLEDWCSDFGDAKIPWRRAHRTRIADEPCWERACEHRDLTFREFLCEAPDSDHWMYFDYKSLKDWIPNESDIFKKVSWAKFGFPEKKAEDSTLWVGSRGAHTPAHQDTYGTNIVAELYGTKRWILFPPETGGLRPTRVPYEESSVYSELNFCCPREMDPFRSLSGGRCVMLEAGDALLVPRGWWHHVQHESPVAIALNVWLPHENDGSARVSEALVRLLVAQLCKDLPLDTTRLLLNPNEDDLADTPLAVLFLQLDTVARAHLDERRKHRRLKRQKTCDRAPSDEPAAFDLTTLATDPRVFTPPSLSGEQLVAVVKESARSAEAGAQDEVDGEGVTSKLTLTRAVINAFCQSDVVEAVKQNLLRSLS